MAASPPTVDLSKVPGFDEAPSIDPASASALDELFKQSSEGDDQPPEDKEKPDPTKTPVQGDPLPEEKPTAEEKPAEEKPATEEKPAVEEKPAAEEKPAEKEEPKDVFSEVQLPPYAKGKSNEAFNKVKDIARERISSVEKERDEIKRQFDELSAKQTEGLPAETEAELKELREFRAKMDVDVSPEFKQYDTQVASNDQSIYDRLTAAGFKPESIEKIKSMGGPSQVDWDSIADKLPVQLRRFIESKLVENEGIVDKKAKAIATAKANATEYMRNREAEVAGSREKTSQAVDKLVKEYVPKLGWFEPRQAKAGATEAEKKAVEEHNKSVEEYQTFLNNAVNDDSPQLRALLAVGYVQLQKSRSDMAAYKSAKDAEVTTLKVELADAKKLLEKIKNSSSARLRGSSAPPASDKPTVNLDTSPADALDALARQHQA